MCPYFLGYKCFLHIVSTYVSWQYCGLFQTNSSNITCVIFLCKQYVHPKIIRLVKLSIFGYKCFLFSKISPDLLSYLMTVILIDLKFWLFLIDIKPCQKKILTTHGFLPPITDTNVSLKFLLIQISLIGRMNGFTCIKSLFGIWTKYIFVSVELLCFFRPFLWLISQLLDTICIPNLFQIKKTQYFPYFLTN